MLGAGFALISAVTFGLNNAALRRGVLTGGVLQAMAITVPLGVPLFAVVCLASGGTHSLSGLRVSGWIWMSLAGVVHFVFGRYGNYRATRALGTTLSSPIQQLSVPISLILAMIFLRETLTPLKILGFALVMLGPLIMMRKKKGAAPKVARSGFMPRYGEGLLWGGVCAFAYGTSPLLIMMGLGTHGRLAESLAGGLVSYSAAAVVVLGLVSLSGGLAFMATLDAGAKKWFIFSGVGVFASQMFRYMALAVAPVTVVVPIQRLSIVFRVIFGWLFNRDHEIIGFWVLFGIGVSLVGAVSLCLSTNLVISEMPAAWARFLAWHWP